MQKQVVTFTLNNQILNPADIANWQEIQLVANFDNDDVQATLDIDNLDLVNGAAAIVQEVVNEGKNGTGAGVFQGVEFTIAISTQGTSRLEYQAYLDLTQLRFTAPNQCTVKVAAMDIQSLR